MNKKQATETDVLVNASLVALAGTSSLLRVGRSSGASKCIPRNRIAKLKNYRELYRYSLHSHTLDCNELGRRVLMQIELVPSTADGVNAQRLDGLGRSSEDADRPN